MGRKLRIGPGWAWNTPFSQPHWKIATTPPNAAKSDMTKPSVAVSGTSSDRKTSTMMTNDSPTTTAR